MNTIIHTLVTDQPCGNHFDYYRAYRTEIDYTLIDDRIDIVSATVTGEGCHMPITVSTMLYNELKRCHRQALQDNAASHIQQLRENPTQ